MTRAIISVLDGVIMVGEEHSRVVLSIAKEEESIQRGCFQGYKTVTPSTARLIAAALIRSADHAEKHGG